MAYRVDAASSSGRLIRGIVGGCLGFSAAALLAGASAGQIASSGTAAGPAEQSRPLRAGLDVPQTVASPLTISTRATTSEFVTALDVDLDAAMGLASLEKIYLVGLPLNGGELIDLDLERTRVMDPGAVRMNGDEVLPARAGEPLNVMFAGEVAGERNSWAYVSFSRFGVRGIVEIDGVTHVISSGKLGEPAGSVVEPIIYDLTNLPAGEINWVDAACDVVDLPAENGNTFGSRGEEPDGDPCRVVNVAIEVDVEFGGLFTSQGENALDALNAYIESLVGAVNVIYRRNVNVRLNIVYTRSWLGFDVEDDPWEGNSTFSRLLELRATWTRTSAPALVDWQSAHMFSAARLGGGVAYLSAICNPDIAHAVSANMSGFFPTTEVSPGNEEPVDNNEQNWDVVVTAHEWGHNFGAPHTHGTQPQIDGCGTGDCGLAESGTIMSYCHLCPGGLGNIELNFAERILNEGIRPYLEFGAPCDLSSAEEECEGPPVEEVCIADVNEDGLLNFSDFIAWLVYFNQGDPRADINGDGQNTGGDFNAWLVAFNEGCEGYE